MSTTTTTNGALERAEQLLHAAGFTFTVVDACPHQGCDVCTRPVADAA